MGEDSDTSPLRLAADRSVPSRPARSARRQPLDSPRAFVPEELRPPIPVDRQRSFVREELPPPIPVDRQRSFVTEEQPSPVPAIPQRIFVEEEQPPPVPAIPPRFSSPPEARKLRKNRPRDASDAYDDHDSRSRRKNSNNVESSTRDSHDSTVTELWTDSTQSMSSTTSYGSSDFYTKRSRSLSPNSIETLKNKSSESSPTSDAVSSAQTAGPLRNDASLHPTSLSPASISSIASPSSVSEFKPDLSGDDDNDNIEAMETRLSKLFPEETKRWSETRQSEFPHNSETSSSPVPSDTLGSNAQLLSTPKARVPSPAIGPREAGLGSSQGLDSKRITYSWLDLSPSPSSTRPNSLARSSVTPENANVVLGLARNSVAVDGAASTLRSFVHNKRMSTLPAPKEQQRRVSKVGRQAVQTSIMSPRKRLQEHRLSIDKHKRSSSSTLRPSIERTSSKSSIDKHAPRETPNQEGPATG
jgi:hypothetical protein